MGQHGVFVMDAVVVRSFSFWLPAKIVEMLADCETNNQMNNQHCPKNPGL